MNKPAGTPGGVVGVTESVDLVFGIIAADISGIVVEASAEQPVAPALLVLDPVVVPGLHAQG